MSFDTVSLAMNACLPPAEKIILLILAHVENHETRLCCPSRKYLSKMACVSERYVTRITATLQQKGLLTIAQNVDEDGRQRSNNYTLHIEQQVSDTGTIVPPPLVSGSNPRVVNSSTPGVNYSSNITENIEQGIITGKEIGASENAPHNRANGKEFEIFWEHWPQKRNKAKARRAFMAKKFDLDDVKELIEDVDNRIKHDKQWKEGFIPHCSTYINGERWEDEYV